MTSRNLKHGTFVKTPAPQIVEILALSGLDFAVLDAEHAPFDIGSLDMMMLAGRAAALPLLVRVPDFEASTLLRTLDLGFAGVLVPHVESADSAQTIMSRCRYRDGTRGFSSSPRSSAYGTLGIQDSVERAQGLKIICQIESSQAVENIHDIAGTPGVYGVFVGRADLALSMGLDSARHPDVLAATDTVIKAGLDAGVEVAMMVGNQAEQEQYAQKGVRWFIHGSDQSLLMQAAARLIS